MKMIFWTILTEMIDDEWYLLRCQGYEDFLTVKDLNIILVSVNAKSLGSPRPWGNQCGMLSEGQGQNNRTFIELGGGVSTGKYPAPVSQRPVEMFNTGCRSEHFLYTNTSLSINAISKFISPIWLLVYCVKLLCLSTKSRISFPEVMGIR